MCCPPCSSAAPLCMCQCVYVCVRGSLRTPNKRNAFHVSRLLVSSSSSFFSAAVCQSINIIILFGFGVSRSLISLNNKNNSLALSSFHISDHPHPPSLPPSLLLSRNPSPKTNYKTRIPSLPPFLIFPPPLPLPPLLPLPRQSLEQNYVNTMHGGKEGGQAI